MNQIETTDSKTHLIALLNELDKIEGELQRRHKENGIEYYTPNSKQMLAHKQTAHEIFYCGGNRAGKTTFAMAEVVMAATGNYRGTYTPEERKFKKPPKIRIISPKFKEGINDVIEPKLRTLMPKKAILGVKRSPQGYIVHMDVNWKDKGISTIDFLSQEQDIMSFEGTDSDLVICDEPMKRSIYIALSRGLLDRNGYLICAYTALKEAWMKEVTDQADGKLRAFIVADIRDNKWDVLGNHILTEKSIQRFEDILSPDEKEIRLHGRYYHLSGLVYKELDQAVHLVDKLPEKYITWASLDPHDRNPHWMIWAAVDPTGDVVIYDELILSGNLSDLAQAIKVKEKNMTIHTRLIDPNFGHKPAAVGSVMSVQDQLRSLKVDFLEGIDDEAAGIAVVREHLRFNKCKPVTFTNKPKLFFLKGAVPHTFKSMMNLQYKEWKHIQDEKEDNENIMEKNKHAADTIRYLLMARPRYGKFKSYQGLDEKIY